MKTTGASKPMNRLKKLCCLLLSLAMTASMLFTLPANALSAYDYTDNPVLAGRLDTLMNDIAPVGSYFTANGSPCNHSANSTCTNCRLDVVVSTLTGLFSGIVTAFISVIFAFYLLVSKDRIAGQLDRIQIRYLKKTWYDKIRYGLCVFNDCFRRYIVGQCLEALILGTLCMVGMMILRLPYAAMVGSLVAVTALIPIAGAYIGAAVGAFMILTVSPMKALIFLIFLVILQQIEGNLIYPKVVGTSLGLPGIWVLAAVTIGGGILGIPGMLLGVPIAAAVYRLLRADVKKPPRDPAFLEH